ncbi:hypothetical protein GWI33_010552 [Rhynchophorus ferrugineus]|uniref:Uncharacterized protein n=1 Tax=Rhynchophorus ferrugineus TaxID=354439 RepID=A0A834MKD2_RHYFE|nr:hypothetical protein GWI33_010552 [Rhynchophorus ferrugineus]
MWKIHGVRRWTYRSFPIANSHNAGSLRTPVLGRTCRTPPPERVSFSGQNGYGIDRGAVTELWVPISEGIGVAVGEPTRNQRQREINTDSIIIY